MQQQTYDGLVKRAARSICARTDVAAKDSPRPIYDVPDELVWIDSATGPVLAARWQLYEERARLALAEVGLDKKLAALTSVLDEIQRARLEDSLPDLALIERLVISALE